MMTVGNLNHKKNKTMMIINKTTKIFWNNFQKIFSVGTLKLLAFAFCLALFTACQTKEKFTLQTVTTETGWGYEIRLDKKLIIKQNTIPVISSNKSFTTQQDAKKTGRLVLNKLESNQSPTLSKNDLLLLGIKI